MHTKIQGQYQDIPEALPLQPTDILFIASDIKPLALATRGAGDRFDANQFIEAFQEKLNQGTLLVPAYTDHLKNGDVFDHLKAKPTTGALSNKVFRRKDFLRSKDPLHSVFVWGEGMDEITTLDGNSSLGAGSIFEWMYQNKAKMLCIDVHFQNSLTFVHYLEELREVKYRKPYRWRIQRVFENNSDEKAFVFYSRKPWVLTDLTLLQKSAIESGVVKEFQFGKSKMLFFDSVEMYDHISGMLDRGEKLHRISLKHFVKNTVKKVLGRG